MQQDVAAQPDEAPAAPATPTGVQPSPRTPSDPKLREGARTLTTADDADGAFEHLTAQLERLPVATKEDALGGRFKQLRRKLGDDTRRAFNGLLQGMSVTALNKTGKNAPVYKTDTGINTEVYYRLKSRVEPAWTCRRVGLKTKQGRQGAFNRSSPCSSTSLNAAASSARAGWCAAHALPFRPQRTR